MSKIIPFHIKKINTELSRSLSMTYPRTPLPVDLNQYPGLSKLPEDVIELVEEHDRLHSRLRRLESDYARVHEKIRKLDLAIQLQAQFGNLLHQ